MFRVSFTRIGFLWLIVLAGCGTSTDRAKQQDSINKPKQVDPRMFIDYKPKWKDSAKVTMAIDTNLSHANGGFGCDSAIIFHYNGAFGEHTFMVLNDKGQWINTIQERKKLTSDQVRLVHSVFGNPSTFKHPLIIGCFEPRIAIVYFKGGKVIAQSDICLGCCRIKSTARLGNKEYYSSMNRTGRAKLDKLYEEVGFK